MRTSGKRQAAATAAAAVVKRAPEHVVVPSDPLIYRPSIPADIESVQQEDDVCTLSIKF